MHNQYVLYFHRNPITQIVFYIGVGNTKRPTDFSKRGRYWKFYVKKHGKPIVEIVKTNLNKLEAYHLEIHYVAFFGRKRYEKNGILINLTKGGDGLNGLSGNSNPNYGKPCPERVKEKLRLLAGPNHPNTGRVKTQESRDKISASRMGRFAGSANVNAKKIIDTNTGVVYGCQSDAAKSIGMSRGVLAHYLCGMLPNKTSLKYLDN